VYHPFAKKSKGDEILTVLFNLLAELKDGHVDFMTKGGFVVKTYTPPRTERDKSAFNPLIVRKYFDKELKLAGNRNMEYEFLSENVGYVRISTFTAGDWIQDFHGILDYFRPAKGLIIDVRNNVGGSDNVSDIVVSRFLSTQLLGPPVYIKGQLQSNSTLKPSGPYNYIKPVAVIINGVCFSTTEQFVEKMKQISTVTVVGDTTAGGSGNPKYYPLPSGKQIRISTTDYRRYDGVPYEWNGVPPDILVQQTVEDIKQGRDKQLERAIQLLR
jgi:C-terminal processing protease CtpA/Prc